MLERFARTPPERLTADPLLAVRRLAGGHGRGGRTAERLAIQATVARTELDLGGGFDAALRLGVNLAALHGELHRRTFRAAERDGVRVLADRAFATARELAGTLEQGATAWIREGWWALALRDWGRRAPRRGGGAAPPRGDPRPPPHEPVGEPRRHPRRRLHGRRRPGQAGAADRGARRAGAGRTAAAGRHHARLTTPQPLSDGPPRSQRRLPIVGWRRPRPPRHHGDAPIAPVRTDQRARRRVVLLGATGSIGRQACDVVSRYPERFELVGAVAGSDVEALAAVVERFGVRHAAVVAPRGEVPAGWGTGIEAACEVASVDADVVLVGVAGAAALRPTLAAVDLGRDIALATKEVLVMAGELVRARAARSGARMLPVDSEHSALWQCLRFEDPATVSRLILTASGGPFRQRPLDTFASITVEDALRHPNWSMGPKITVDSATMMNKGLEIIEAHFLFSVPYQRIDVAVHPPSLIHSMVEFVDGATLAQIGRPDMRLPIALALSGGERLPGVHPPADLTGVPADLHLEPVDGARFPAPALARHAGERGGAAPCILNAANEAAVAAFLDHRCGFTDIVATVEHVVEKAPNLADPSLDDLLELDAWARRQVADLAGAHAAPA